MRDLGNFGVKVLHYEFQYSPHLCFVHSTEPLDEVLDSRALRQIAEKGRHGQPGACENLGPADPAGHAFHRRAFAPVCHTVTFFAIVYSAADSSASSSPRFEFSLSWIVLSKSSSASGSTSGSSAAASRTSSLPVTTSAIRRVKYSRK